MHNRRKLSILGGLRAIWSIKMKSFILNSGLFKSCTGLFKRYAGISPGCREFAFMRMIYLPTHHEILLHNCLMYDPSIPFFLYVSHHYLNFALYSVLFGSRRFFVSITRKYLAYTYIGLCYAVNCKMWLYILATWLFFLYTTPLPTTYLHVIIY